VCGGQGFYASGLAAMGKLDLRRRSQEEPDRRSECNFTSCTETCEPACRGWRCARRWCITADGQRLEGIGRRALSKLPIVVTLFVTIGQHEAMRNPDVWLYALASIRLCGKSQH